jgi:signal transduction histidine kinase
MATPDPFTMLEHDDAAASQAAARSSPRPSHDADVATPSGSSAIEGLRPVIDRLPEAVLITDADGAVRATNAAADRLFAERPVRDDVDLLSRFEDLGRAPKRTGQDEPTRRLTVRPRHQPNTWFALDRVPLQSMGRDDGRGEADDATGAVYLLRDVSDSGDLQAEREAFLAVLSHELRTPLTTIYAGSSVLAKRPRLSPPATRTLALDISAEAARLYDLVENLLVIARLERRILDPLDEPVDLGRTVDAAVRTLAERFPDTRIVRTGVRRPAPVHGDATYVEQALRNLLLAAVTVTEGTPEQTIEVRVDVDEPGREVAVRVLDRGPALLPEELERAFELPSTSATGRLATMGMGPFVVRHAVDAMNGRTWARNREDGGLEMSFALPLDEGPERRR